MSKSLSHAIFAIVGAVAVSGCSANGSTGLASSLTGPTASVNGQLVRRTSDDIVPILPANPVPVPCLPPAQDINPPGLDMNPPAPSMDVPYLIARTVSAASHLVRPKDNGTAPCQTNLWTVGVVSSFGNLAFNPNPTNAAMGEMLTWTNNDLTTHRLVLDDGSINGLLIGVIAPGESTQPIVLTTPTATYHCTIHPSMVGYIGNVTPPPDLSPAPDPGYGPDPGYYGYKTKRTN